MENIYLMSVKPTIANKKTVFFSSQKEDIPTQNQAYLGACNMLKYLLKIRHI
jgi:hypothetical protein